MRIISVVQFFSGLSSVPRIYCLVLVVSFFSEGFSLDNGDFQNFLNNQRCAIDSMRDARNAAERLIKKNQEEDMSLEQKKFEAWLDQERKYFEEYKSKIESKWGYFVSSSKKTWVEYSNDCNSMGMADFERGVVTVEVLRDKEENSDSLKKKIAGAVERMLSSRGRLSFLPLQDSLQQALDKPVLEEQICDKTGKKIDSSSVLQFSDNIAENALKNLASDSNKIKISIPLSSDHVFQRAKRFHGFVLRYCDLYKLDYAHVMATIHTESLFNPMSKSQENALGLMQIVPQQGGREAFRLINGYDEIPLPGTLYDPETNIKFGCAYIYILKNRYFGAVFDGQSRLFCSIAGYNTGPGNVAFAFTGGRSLDSAVGKINELDNSTDVYSYLLGHLPFYETRNYLRKVTETMKIYIFKGRSPFSGGTE
jgi:membrane-bound lytic murein transglycosylase C